MSRLADVYQKVLQLNVRKPIRLHHSFLLKYNNNILLNKFIWLEVNIYIIIINNKYLRTCKYP